MAFVALAVAGGVFFHPGHTADPKAPVTDAYEGDTPFDRNDSNIERRHDPCDDLNDDLAAGTVDPLTYGFPAFVQVNIPEPIGVMYCFSRQPEGQIGTVMGVAVVSDSGDDVWLILSESSHYLSESEWLQVLADHGFADVIPFSNGYATREPTANGLDVWEALQTDTNAP